MSIIDSVLLLWIDLKCIKRFEKYWNVYCNIFHFASSIRLCLNTLNVESYCFLCDFFYQWKYFFIDQLNIFTIKICMCDTISIYLIHIYVLNSFILILYLLSVSYIHSKNLLTSNYHLHKNHFFVWREVLPRKCCE